VPRPHRTWLAPAAAVLAAACGNRIAPGPTPPEEHPAGLWFDMRYGPRASLLSETERRRAEDLGHLGYVDVPGLNLYCSGHAAEAVLMDMAGEVLQRWKLP